MNSAILRNHNSRVKDGDTVFHIGDFCLAGSTNILTPSGIKKISSLKIGDKVYSVKINNASSVFNNQILSISTIKKTFKTKSKKRLRIHLENGYSILSTENHPFATRKNNTIKWKKAKNLTAEDILFERVDIGEKIQNNIKRKNYFLGYIFGYMYGDGHFSSHGWSITSIDIEGISRIVKYVKLLFNKNIVIKKTKQNRYFRIRIPKDICVSLSKYDVFNKKIDIKKRQWYIGFLAGIFDAEGSCGCTKTHKNYEYYTWYVSISNTNKKIITFISLLFKYFHIKTNKIYKYTPKGYKNICYSIPIKKEDIFKFFTLLTPAIKRKYPKLSILSNGIKVKKIEILTHKYNKEFINYNLNVYPNNNFFANGVLVHNCFRNSKGGKVGEGTQSKAKDEIKKFNGNMIFICGNHDKNNSLKTIIQRLVIKYGNYRMNLVHDPEFADYNYTINLVGHVHNRWEIKRFRRGEAFTDCINVGVDVWNFRPVSFEEILSRYMKWKKREKLQ